MMEKVGLSIQEAAPMFYVQRMTPSEYGISRGMDGARYRSLGNAVIVPVIEWIGKRILLSIESQVFNNLDLTMAACK